MNALDRERIYAAGEEKGRAAGSWVVDGNTSAEWARSVLVMLDDGDPAIEGHITEPSPLSGEWAGESIPEIAYDLRVDPDSDEWMEPYEEGFSAGFWEQVETDLQACATLDADS